MIVPLQTLNTSKKQIQSWKPQTVNNMVWLTPNPKDGRCSILAAAMESCQVL